VAGGAAALNQVFERTTDGLMRRTRSRPLPAGRLGAAEGSLLGAWLSLLGLAELAYFTNTTAAAVAALTLASYVFLYTPLKTRTSLATLIGAVPGALPPVIGWTAATGVISEPALVLFGIVFLWQMPHFLAIAWMYRDDYARAGIPLLPVLEPDGRRGIRRCHAAVLWPVSLLPVITGLAGVPCRRRHGIGVPLHRAQRPLRAERSPATAPAALDPLRRCCWGARRQPHLDNRPACNLKPPGAERDAQRHLGACLTLGYIFIRRRDRVDHKRAMLTALGSALFLVSCVTYHANVGSKPPGHGPVRAIYLTILVTHIVLPP
jgi:hypothetical protein